MRPALLLVDVQLDFLGHPSLAPPASELVACLKRVVAGFRACGVPVVHVHTLVSRDGADRMPHHADSETWRCLEGTPGAAPPPGLEPLRGEPVFSKSYFGAFSNAALEPHLRAAGVDTVVLGGVHLHACVRQSAIEAYQRGFGVRVLEDGVGSYDSVHAELTRSFLDARAMKFRTADEVLVELDGTDRPARGDPVAGRTSGDVPVGMVDGRPVEPAPRRVLERRNPSDWGQVVARVPLGGGADVARAAASAVAAQREWGCLEMEERARRLAPVAGGLASARCELARLMADEIGKPVADGAAEVDQAVQLVRGAIASLGAAEQAVAITRDVSARRRPHGVVAVVTPWNNPVAIPVGKVIPALLLGNGVVLKPALHAPRTALRLHELLNVAGLPPGVLNLLFGDAVTALRLIDHPAVAAVSVTGSSVTGRAAAAACARRLKPLQAELGGNNPVVVLGDCDLQAVARTVARAAFGFAGQRCTAPRRIIVEVGAAAEFSEAFRLSAEQLVVGSPQDAGTQMGPLVSMEARGRVEAALSAALAGGGRRLCGGPLHDRGPGCWFAPAVVDRVRPESGAAQEETFGPLALLHTARDLEEAIRLCNTVRQGLVATLFTNDRDAARRFRDRVEAGIVKLNRFPAGAEPAAPFGGWKESGLGPPEHGAWDAEFYSRPQSLYGFEP